MAKKLSAGPKMDHFGVKRGLYEVLLQFFNIIIIITIIIIIIMGFKHYISVPLMVAHYSVVQ